MTDKSPSRISAEVDFDRDGKQQGFLRLPYSVHSSAYGWLAIPVIVLKNGDGPSVLLTAGNHGDEYEGQMALLKLARELQADAVRGRIIIVPALNFPAAMAGLRTSPLDAGNLNRSFPGDADGHPTSMIAHYTESELLPLVDYALDLHSGGSSLVYTPSATASVSDDPIRSAAIRELLEVFAAPLAYVAVPQGEDRTMSAAAERAGVIYLGTELGGAGTVTPETVRIAERGVGRVLRHLGCAPALDCGPEPAPTRLLEVGGNDYFVYSPDRGIWEPLVDLGAEVQAGQAAATIHFPDTPWREPVTAHFATAGTVICKRVPSRAERGDCLYHLGTDLAA